MNRRDFQYLLFDLDGTLTDPKQGTMNGIIYTLDYFGIKDKDLSEIDRFIGPPLKESLQKFYGFDAEKADMGVKVYRQYYSEKGLFENVMYEGVDKVLKYLKQCGKTLIVATSKPEEFAVRILKSFGLEEYFDLIAGSLLNGERTTKREVINYALETMKITDRSKCLMIGDRMHDIIGAKEAGIASLGVLYGYGSKKELSDAGADFIVEKAEDIITFIIDQ